MKFYIQKGADKPIGLPIKDMNLAQIHAKKKYIVIKGIEYRVIGILDNIDQITEPLFEKKGGPGEADTGAYDRLKANIEQFRKTKIWPDKN